MIAKEASTKVPVEYTNFVDEFFSDLASKLSEHTGINDHAIELVNDHLSHPQVLPSFLIGCWTDADLSINATKIVFNFEGVDGSGGHSGDFDVIFSVTY